MTVNNSPGFERIIWRDLGIICFYVFADQGQQFSFNSPVTEFSLSSPAVTLVLSGSFRAENPNRDPIEWPALPVQAEGGIVFPGLYTGTALENNSRYVCLSPLPKSIFKEGFSMFSLDHSYHQETAKISFQYKDGYVAAIVMSGCATSLQGGTVIATGGRIDVPVDGVLSLVVEAGTHLVGYRRSAGNT